jgi:hypothetical protein
VRSLLLAVDDGLISGNPTFADVCFIIAIVFACAAAVGHFGANQLTKHAGWLLCLAVAAISLGWLVL